MYNWTACFIRDTSRCKTAVNIGLWRKRGIKVTLTIRVYSCVFINKDVYVNKCKD